MLIIQAGPSKLMRHKKDPVHVFQPSLVVLFATAPSCPLATETGDTPVIHRIERWAMKVSVRPIENKFAFRVIVSKETRRRSLDVTACGHPGGCSIAGQEMNLDSSTGLSPDGGASHDGSDGLRRRSSFMFGSRTVERVDSDFECSFADDLMIVRLHSDNSPVGSSDYNSGANSSSTM